LRTLACPAIDKIRERRRRVVAGLCGRTTGQAIFDLKLWRDLRAEAVSDPQVRLITPELISLVEGAHDARAISTHWISTRSRWI
jgi:hypothetical protein